MNDVKFKVVTLLWLIGLACARFIDSNGIPKSKEISRMSNQDDYVKSRYPRLSETEWSTYSVREPNGPGSFAFGYDNVLDSAGNEHYRSEERFENGTVIGEYGFTDSAINRMIRVTYIADHLGYRANMELLPMEDYFSRTSISN